jgi:iron complex outermembrane receptor protein
MRKAKQISLAVSAALGSGLLGLAPGALAQTTGSQSLERVEITGSLLRRIEGETALPVTTISADELVKAGVTNAEQAMRLVTQGGTSLVSSGSVSQTNGAASYASLRGLGAQRTLVLLNGKRVVSNPYSAVAVDLNTLPVAALERIEVLTDGASSTYGTDAIAGVINFITRKDYKGVTVGGEVQWPEEGGGEVYTANVLAGFGSLAKDGWNVYGGFNYRKQEPMLGTERDFMKTSYIPERGFSGLSPTTFPANYTQSSTGVNTNPTWPACQPPLSISTPGVAPPVGLSGSICGADTQGFTTVVPDQEQWSGILKGSLALGQNHTASIEYFFSRNTLFRTIAPSPEGGLTMTPANPFYPGKGITPITDTRLDPTAPISISWRTTVLGARENEQVNDTQRAVAALEGVIAGWDYQLAALWSNAQVQVGFGGGYGAITALRNGMSGSNGAPYLNPFGDQTPEGLAFLQSTAIRGTLQDMESTLSSLTAVASRQFGNLPGGPMSIGLGAEFRKEDNVYTTDVAKASQTTSSGLAGQAPLREGDRDIWAVALEMSFPVLKNLEIGASVRFDDYSDFGSTTNPKVSFKYTPMQNLLLRGSYNTGFAAPTLAQLNAPNTTTFTGSRYNDPVLCPGGVVNTAAGGIASRDCGIQFQQLQGGNRALTPEESTAWTVGFILQPTPQVSFGVDYWDYTVTNNIGTIGDPAIFADPVKYANLFVRCSQADPARIPTIPGCNIPGGDPLAYVINTNLNLGDTKTSGFDIQFNWNPGATSVGRFAMNWRGTYVTNYEFQKEPGGPWFNPVGNYNTRFTDDGGSPGPVIRFKQVLSLGWEMNAYTAGLTWRFTSGYHDSNPSSSVSAPYRNNAVGNYNVWDLSFGYTGIKGLTLRAGVLNLLDEDPPYTNQTARFQARAYDDRFHNPLGRTWVLGAKYEF